VTTTRPPARWPAEVLAGIGVLSIAALAVLVARTGHLEVAGASALPAAFFVAGLIGARARPDHTGVLLLLAMGTSHLAGFALTAWAGATEHPTGWATWAVAVAGDAAYLAGFVLLALLIADYPSARTRSRWVRRLAVAGGSFAALALAVETTLHARLGLALGSVAQSVAVPSPVRLATDGPSLVDLAPALAACGLVVLLVRARSLPEPDRAALGWAKVAGSVLVLMLAATPAAQRVLPAPAWDGTFVVVVSLVPFLLLAGLVRYRLLQVELYLVRTLARGAVVVLVLSLYAVAEAVLDGRDAAVAAVVLTVAAALTGVPLVRLLQRLADRWLAGGRVASRTVFDQLTSAIAVADRDGLGRRICRSVADGLDVAWVRIVVRGTELATTGRPSGAAEVAVPLRSGATDVGVLECGPRRGGWSRAEVAELQTIATPVALALRDAELTSELTERVEELTVSRARLAEAERTVRRQVERDLHDGAQQQLVALLARLGVARALLADGTPAAGALSAAHDLAQQCLRELRDLVTGLHPAVLEAQGLTGAVEARAALLPIPVAVDADPRIADARFPPEVESAAFFVVSEALANTLKHSGSDRARVVLAPLDAGGLRVAVSDEGAGTASFQGSGLVGLRARVEALGGRFSLRSIPAVGTTVLAEFDVPAAVAAGA
jgi:signal transduction histidine kinase